MIGITLSLLGMFWTLIILLGAFILEAEPSTVEMLFRIAFVFMVLFALSVTCSIIKDCK